MGVPLCHLKTKNTFGRDSDITKMGKIGISDARTIGSNQKGIYSMASVFYAEKFLRAQEGAYGSYASALKEIRRGRKDGHWIWYIFPQIAGLGSSCMSEKYALHSLQEAREYLRNKLLRKRLVEISEALLENMKDIQEIMWDPDDLKVRSCMTLFREADPSIPVFQKVLDAFFNGEADEMTLQILEEQKSSQANIKKNGYII